MRRDEVLQRIREHRTDLDRFGVKSLSLFGSVARDEAGQQSDVDVLVEFAKPVGLFEFVRLKAYLETLLGCEVDLVTRDALRDRMRARILNEAIHAG